MIPHYHDDLITLYAGDAATVLDELPARTVQTMVTSPPYFGLRSYGTEPGEIGAPGTTLDEYVGSLVGMFDSVHRVLTDDGTAWLNMGDTYVGKQLQAAPWRTALALQARGWFLRSDIIWAKPNTLPTGGVDDRPTTAHEYIFLLAKQSHYYYDAEAIAEPSKEASFGRYKYRYGGQKQILANEVDKRVNTLMGHRIWAETRNKRDVWTVSNGGFSGAHFATYPPELIRPCILAGSRVGDVVLDPFSGSGTTGMVATQEGRRYIGIDLNAHYLDISLRSRFAQPPLDIWGEQPRAADEPDEPLWEIESEGA